MFPKTHAIINLESSGRNPNTSISPTNFIYQLTQPINFHNRSKRKQYFIRPENIRIPISFYNINSNFNVFNWVTSTTGSVSFTLTQGNYTIDEIIAEIQVQMNALDLNTYTITYDDKTQKVNIQSDGVENITSISGNGWQVIGFELTQTITGATNEDGNNVAYTNTAKHFRLVLDNIVSGNYYANDENQRTQIQRVGINIPITEIRNEIQFYTNHEGPMIKLSDISSIREFNVRLVDANNNTVDLNGVPWGCDIVVYEINKI